MRAFLVSNLHMRRGGGLLVGLAVLVAGADSIQSQERSLTIVSATPRGEVAQIADAGEMRIVFSEPMVAIGGEVTRPPEWLSLSPAIRANYYWSGTRTLIVTADPDTPLPYATRYTATIGAGARSVAGHAIASPFAFTFTTPTIRLLGADWYRKSGRFDSPAVIALRFNQPVRPADVLAHATVRYTPHTWTRPALTAPARDLLAKEDLEGLARFDAKVERVARVVSLSDAVPLTGASGWDEKRFPPSPNVAVVETAGAPATDAWLTVAIDGGMPGADGPEAAAAQS
ncbi:MAG TPA: Ig-like domain-containing protein, partial [Vicinamibacterales bacterium]|nr:Ig-like domain-containing protein [Vicinamibacterales bacterium]